MRTQSEMVDVTGLDFSGAEQITDALFHIFLRKSLTMPKVRSITVSGEYTCITNICSSYNYLVILKLF